MSRNESVNVWITEHSTKDMCGNDVILTSLAREAVLKAREEANKIATDAFIQANGNLHEFIDLIEKV